MWCRQYEDQTHQDEDEDGDDEIVRVAYESHWYCTA